MVHPLDVVIGERRSGLPQREGRPFVIVVGVDFGRATHRAVDVAVRAAARHSAAEVHLVAVAPYPLSFGFAPIGPAREAALDARREQLAAVVSGAAPPPAHVRMFAYAIAGTVASVLTVVARRFTADLIVLGTAGTSAPACLVRSSVARSVLASAPCVVMTIDPPLILPGQRRES
jgi:nucleotide-binding universal stress UspA family protein